MLEGVVGVLGEGGDGSGDAHVSQNCDGCGNGRVTTCLVGRASACSLGQMARVASPRELGRSRWEGEREFWRNAVGDDGIVEFRRLIPTAYSHSSFEGLNARGQKRRS
jgi:hypothetical protein